MTKSNGATNLSADYATIRATYPHLTKEIVDALNEAVLAGLPPGTNDPMAVIGPRCVTAYEWAEALLEKSPLLYGVMQAELLIRVEKKGEIRFEER